MENLNHRVLGIMGIFKTPYRISPADKYTVYLAIHNLIRVLPGFFKCLELGQPTDVSMALLKVKGNPKYSQRYLLVLKRISDVIGTQLYCKKILEGNESKPIEQIYIIGQQAELTLVNVIANYLYTMTLGICNSSRFSTKGRLTGKAHTKEWEIKIYLDTFNKLEQALPLRVMAAPSDGLEKRNKKVLDYIINNLKLDYNKKNNPMEPDIENARSLPGLFKSHKLL